MNRSNNLIGIILGCIFLITGCQNKITPPDPYGVLPSERHMDWHMLETYAFLHFTTNTFTDLEWGYGDEKPEVFNPSDFDADQIVGTLAKAGFKGAILTAKHHDGFCLWPSKYTEHSVKNSPWKNGKGDVVREISEACKKYDVKFGVYLSPWDRNHPDYGQPEYIGYYRGQLEEMLTNYGEIFELWVDGANGGNGYYGGAREERNINRAEYYQWDSTFALVYKLQPEINIFSDNGPDLRWVGNEHGHANDSCWSTYTPLAREGEAHPAIGKLKHWLGETGTMNGKYWMPAETDVSIRPGWFYHEHEDDKVKSLDGLLDIYFHSVGNGTSLNLNIPPDRTGQIHETDSIRLMEFKGYLDKAFSKDLLEGCNVEASNIRGSNFQARNLTDNDPATYWTTKDQEKSGIIEFHLNRTETFNCIVLHEYIRLGQRVTNFSIEVLENEQWKEVANGSTIGYKKIIRFDDHNTDKLRINIKGALACPLISKISAFEIPMINEEDIF